MSLKVTFPAIFVHRDEDATDLLVHLRAHSRTHGHAGIRCMLFSRRKKILTLSPPLHYFVMLKPILCVCNARVFGGLDAESSVARSTGPSSLFLAFSPSPSALIVRPLNVGHTRAPAAVSHIPFPVPLLYIFFLLLLYRAAVTNTTTTTTTTTIMRKRVLFGHIVPSVVFV